VQHIVHCDRASDERGEPVDLGGGTPHQLFRTLGMIKNYCNLTSRCELQPCYVQYSFGSLDTVQTCAYGSTGCLC
jgi:hypothetical protein